MSIPCDERFQNRASHSQTCQHDEGREPEHHGGLAQPVQLGEGPQG
jgi:hypothetical protein